MRITCPPHSAEWVVLARWHGAERPVFRGSVFACLAFARERRQARPSQRDLVRASLDRCPAPRRSRPSVNRDHWTR